MSDEDDETTGKPSWHRKTFEVPGHEMSLWLTNEFFKSIEKALNADTLKAIMNRLEAGAKAKPPRYSIFLRVGHFEGKFYLDLGNETWSVIEIDESGWRKVNDPPICFRRTDGMTDLPDPTENGIDDKSIEANWGLESENKKKEKALKTLNILKSFLNIKSEEDFVLVVCWLLAALSPNGPYPVLVLSGEQGTAKSTFARILRSLIDPNQAPLRSLPEKDGDLIVAAHNSHALVFDNVSGFSGDVSDTLCRIATGAGHGKRQLYKDNTEVIFDGSRPIILNGITDFVTRSDLADRSITVELEPIPPENRCLEKDLWKAFDKEKPRILGVLLNGMVEGLKRLPEIPIPKELPRMADFHLWSVACETEFWPEGTFNGISDKNHSRMRQKVLDNDVVAIAILALINQQDEKEEIPFLKDLEKNSGKAEKEPFRFLETTPTKLLNILKNRVPDSTTRSQSWPKSPANLTSRLKRLTSAFREIGIVITTDIRKGHKGTRMTSIEKIDPPDNPSSADDADDGNDLSLSPSKNGTSTTSSTPFSSDSRTIGKTSSASSALTQVINNSLIYKDKSQDKMLTTPLTTQQHCRQHRQQKTGENPNLEGKELNLEGFDVGNRNADDKTVVADDVLTTPIVSNQDRFCGACIYFKPDSVQQGQCNEGMKTGRFFRFSSVCRYFRD